MIVLGSTLSALHTMKVEFANWLSVNVCWYHIDSKNNLMPARLYPFMIRLNDSFAENWGLKYTYFAYVESDLFRCYKQET